MAKIWRNRIIARTQLYENCPAKWQADVLVLLYDAVTTGEITAEEFEEFTGEVYAA